MDGLHFRVGDQFLKGYIGAGHVKALGHLSRIVRRRAKHSRDANAGAAKPFDMHWADKPNAHHGGMDTSHCCFDAPLYWSESGLRLHKFDRIVLPSAALLPSILTLSFIGLGHFEQSTVPRFDGISEHGDQLFT
jgi:hypothetical protein